MMCEKSACHGASVRVGERCGIRRQHPLRLTPPLAGWPVTNRREKPRLPAHARPLPGATEIPSAFAVQTLSPTPADHLLPACRKDTECPNLPRVTDPMPWAEVSSSKSTRN